MTLFIMADSLDWLKLRRKVYIIFTLQKYAHKIAGQATNGGIEANVLMFSDRRDGYPHSDTLFQLRYQPHAVTLFMSCAKHVDLQCFVRCVPDFPVPDGLIAGGFGKNVLSNNSVTAELRPDRGPEIPADGT